MLRITPSIALDESEIVETHIRASGPGGQNVNKVATAVQFRFDAKASSAISAPMFARLRALAGQRMTKDGVLIITADRHRTQERNRSDAYARLADLIARAAIAPKYRRPTKPSRTAKAKRVETKKKAGRTKALRGRPGIDD